MKDHKIEVSEELVKNYAEQKNITNEQARKLLEENFEKEAESVDLRQMYVKLIKSYRELAPKVAGVDMREQDMDNRIKSISNEILSIKQQIVSLNEKLDVHKDSLQQTLRVVDNMLDREQKNAAMMEKLKVPFHKKVWDKIKCLLRA